MSDNRKLNILGSEYDYIEESPDNDAELIECDGYVDPYSKRIVVCNDYNENAYGAIRDFDAYKAKIKRHECIHAFLHESGMSEWQNDEKLVDFLAIQIPKMLKAFQEVDAI